jgi:hypothetical protein
VEGEGSGKCDSAEDWVWHVGLMDWMAAQSGGVASDACVTQQQYEQQHWQQQQQQQRQQKQQMSLAHWCL